MSDQKQEPHPSAGREDRELQPDPMLREGRLSRRQTWLVALGAILVFVMVMYGMISGTQVATFYPEKATPTNRSSTNTPLTQRGGANPPLVEPQGSGR